ncbi:MAG: hypothetical protein JWQ76_2842 [Ramlibacter sp.]|nr:hypothetical protein [Ramlibacter sp.]
MPANRMVATMPAIALGKDVPGHDQGEINANAPNAGGRTRVELLNGSGQIHRETAVMVAVSTGTLASRKKGCRAACDGESGVFQSH